MLRMPVRDATAGFRAYRAEILEKVGLDQVRGHQLVERRLHPLGRQARGDSQRADIGARRTRGEHAGSIRREAVDEVAVEVVDERFTIDSLHVEPFVAEAVGDRGVLGHGEHNPARTDP